MTDLFAAVVVALFIAFVIAPLVYLTVLVVGGLFTTAAFVVSARNDEPEE